MTRRMAVAAAGADVIAVSMFAAAGRQSHVEAGALLGMLGTAGPFLLALGAGWVLARAWRSPVALRTALVVWPVTVVGGLALRAAFTGRLPLAFAVVTAVALGVLLFGWRGVVAVAARRRSAIGR